MRIEQTSVYLKNLVQDAISGALLPAAFQRPYVWTRADALALFESILRGYPVGGFLIWTPYAKADASKVARTRLGPVQLTHSAQAQSFILDGQNRLATMAWLAKDPEETIPYGLTDHEKDVWAKGDQLVIDCERKALRWVSPSEMSSGLRLPAGCLLDSRLTNREVRKNWDTTWAHHTEAEKNEALKVLDLCSRAFSDAKVIVTNLEHASAVEAKDAFLHICKVGVPMAESDLEAAVAWAR